MTCSDKSHSIYVCNNKWGIKSLIYRLRTAAGWRGYAAWGRRPKTAVGDCYTIRPSLDNERWGRRDAGHGWRRIGQRDSDARRVRSWQPSFGYDPCCFWQHTNTLHIITKWTHMAMRAFSFSSPSLNNLSVNLAFFNRNNITSQKSQQQ